MFRRAEWKWLQGWRKSVGNNLWWEVADNDLEALPPSAAQPTQHDRWQTSAMAKNHKYHNMSQKIKFKKWKSQLLVTEKNNCVLSTPFMSSSLPWLDAADISPTIAPLCSSSIYHWLSQKSLLRQSIQSMALHCFLVPDTKFTKETWDHAIRRFGCVLGVW